MSNFPKPFKSEMEFHRYIAQRYVNKLNNAVERGIEFTLTLPDLLNIYKRRNCYLSGKKLVFGVTNKEDPMYATLDRVDNTLGYTSKNTKLVALAVNQIKSQFEREEGLLSLNELVKIGLNLNAHLKGDKK